MLTKTIVSLCTLLLGITALATPEPVTVGITRAYVPIGFDDNDVTQIVIEGNFPNTCYKVGGYRAKVDKQNKTIEIRQGAYQYPGPCLQLVVPFSQVVNTGILEAAVYTILDGSTGKTIGTLPIDVAKHVSPDDFLYAPLTDAYIETKQAPKSRTLTLTGSFPNRCMEMREVRVQYYPDVIVVQPIVERSGQACIPVPTRFVYSVALDPKLGGDYLLHVRSMNGQAINKLVYLF